MNQCPSCQAEFLDSADGLCPACGAELTDAGDTTASGYADRPLVDRTIVDDQGTLQDRAVTRTRSDLTEDASLEDTGTVDDRGFKTLDSVRFGDGDQGGTQIEDSSRTTGSQPRAGSQGDLGELWGKAATQQSSPLMTIRGDASVDDFDDDSTLVIQSRAFRESAMETSDEADYDLLDKLGEGGMGVVYMARQASIDRTVAVKMLKPRAAIDSAQKSKFLAEAVITGDLEHPNIVPIYDLGKNDRGALFYAMKRVKGTPWDEVIKQKTLTENLEILMKMCDAVAFAHSRGIIHRDLKPENTMLGDFGEVLVMDWGLALPIGQHEKANSIAQKPGMGGTPAYMAPEMATGPFSDLGPASDVYLLGATLYEIVTGRPPHRGRDVMKCLYAAARNEIVGTDKEGELVEIARKAMSTEISDRYPSVAAFQTALRDYQEHSDSIAMESRAHKELQEARESNDYEAYAKALFGFQEAVNLWDGNRPAEEGVQAAKLAYAESAFRKGDLDLGASLLDSDDANHVGLKQKIARAGRDRRARQRRLRLAVRAIAVLAATVLVVVSVALVVVHNQKRIAEDAKQKAEEQRILAVRKQKEATRNYLLAERERKRALDAQQEADQQRDVARENQQRAIEQRALAVENARRAVEQQQLAETNAQEAEKERQNAEIQRRNAEEQRDAAQYESYVALIGLAAAKIEENAFVDARKLLTSAVCKPSLRGWEWGRLMHLCNQMVREFETGSRVEEVAFSPDNSRFATAGWNGAAIVWDTRSGAELFRLEHEGSYVHGIAFSPDGHYLATGSDDPNGTLRIWDALSGHPVSEPMQGHRDAVTSVEFSPSGRWLVSTSFDGQARVWNLQDPHQPHTEHVLHGHTWWVWDAAFSPDERWLATASQDGVVLVWSLEDGSHRPPFLGHSGPVYAVDFTPDGESLVSGGYDKSVLLWRPDDLRPLDFAGVLADNQEAEANYRRLEGHTAAVRSIDVVRAHGKTLIASSGHDNTIRLWSAESLSLLHTMRGHGSWVRSCKLSLDGKFVISGAYDASLPAKLWSIDGYAEERVLRGQVLRGHFDAITSAAFSPDGERVVTAARDRTARVWNVRTGESLLILEDGHSFLASTAEFFDDDKRLITSAMDNTTRVWDVASGVEQLTLTRTGRAAAAAASQRGDRIVTGSDSNSAKLWDADTGALLAELAGGHRREVTAVDFSLDDQLIATGDANGRCVLWDAEGNEQQRLSWHTSKITAVHFLAGGQWLITASDDKTVTRWSVPQVLTAEDPQPDTSWILKHPDSVLSIAFSADGGRGLTACADGNVRYWDLDRGKLLRTLSSPDPSLAMATLSPDGLTALTVHDRENRVRRWDLKSGRELLVPSSRGDLGPFLDSSEVGLVWAAEFTSDGQSCLTIGGNEARLWSLRHENSQRREMMSFGPHASVAAASFSPNGRRVVTASWDNSARIWDAEDGSLEQKLINGHAGYVNSAVFAPSGKEVLTASDDGTAKLWSLATGKVIQSFTGHTGRVHEARFSSDGRYVITASSDKSARLWDVESGALVQLLRGHRWAVLSAVISADGQRAITGSDDNTARVWDLATGETLHILSGHTAAVTSVSFSRDGGRALTASADFTAKLWDTNKGDEILNLKGHQEEVTSVSFSNDNRFALTGSRDGTAIVWLAVDWRTRGRGDGELP